MFWSWATFNVAQAFLPWNWGSESYYDYGTGGNVYYEGDTVHTGTPPCPADEYADQAEQLATEVPKVENPDAMEWLPLGVFALTQDGVADAVPNMFLQLAVSKEGIIAGTYQNKSTGQIESVEGMVDQKESTCRDDNCGQEHADFGNWSGEYDQERNARARPFRRRPDAAMVDAACRESTGRDKTERHLIPKSGCPGS